MKTKWKLYQRWINTKLVDDYQECKQKKRLTRGKILKENEKYQLENVE